ncbi:MAG: TAXI family TRAP transporter solute-binding subunit [Rhodospirillaceae bacterium]
MAIKFRALVLAAAVGMTTVLLASCLGPLTIVLRAPVTVATADPAAIYYPVGNAICRIVNLANADDPDKRCQATVSEGAAANVEKVRGGDATFGLTQSDLAYGAYRTERSAAAAIAPGRELRSVIALQRESFTVIARAAADIHDFQDLRGKRVGIGKTGAGYTFTRDVVLGFYGWTISDFDRALELGPAEQNRTLCNGDVDAIIFEAAHPDGLAQEATNGCRTRLVRVSGPPIARLLATHPYYVSSVIPGGLYKGNPEDTPTFSTQTLMVTSARQPDDLIYAVVKAVFENFEDLRRLHPALSTLTRRDMVPGEAVIPIHPGALRYYREAGLLP